VVPDWAEDDINDRPPHFLFLSVTSRSEPSPQNVHAWHFRAIRK
jgi:hypothetical protein